MLQDIVTAFSGSVISSPDRDSNTSMPYSTTLNVQQCYLCSQPAEDVYHTTAFTWQGRYWPSVERHLCTICMRAACGLLVEEPKITAIVEQEYERGESEAVA